jgi:3D (Asp-Asp-Asp) domain-containing protein
MRRRTWISVLSVALGVAVVSGVNLAPAGAATASGLPACKHFSDVKPPNRPPGPSHDSKSKGPKISLAGRLPAPSKVSGTYAGGKVTITFNRVPGATAYRVWRNAQSVAWVSDWGQPALTAVDTHPCRHGNYTIVALRSDAGDASTGQLSGAYRLEDRGVLAPFRLAAGTKLSYKVTSYNDGGLTASGYRAGLGKCAVDARFIPLGTRFQVAGYGWCYAADIGLWIQGSIVDIWLPGGEADNWGVQQRTITIG